ncbi:hypothetical protein SDC9_22255 [bioreactor metagenome]|uniref:Uncharacterized protein n=1 Tax=bioreactor metagenome TaxID=1076179 RepID=A0A644UC46_9ZZZZ|nr:hypothetical protein [Acidaminococcaceae bacterium]
MYYPITKASVFRVSEQIAAIFELRSGNKKNHKYKIRILDELGMLKYDRIKLKFSAILQYGLGEKKSKRLITN